MNPSYRSDLFLRCREAVPALEAARFYGLDVKHNNTACCPFHADDKPSLSFSKGYFRCFGCGAHGDSVNYVSMLFGLKPIDAVRKLDRDFGLQLPIDSEQTREDRMAMRRTAAQMKAELAFQAWKEKTQRTLCTVYRIGHKALADGRELTNAEAMAVRLMDRAEYILDNYEDEDWRRWWNDGSS